MPTNQSREAVVITVSQTIVMKLRGKKPSNSPAMVVGKIHELQPKDEKQEFRLANLVHFTTLSGKYGKASEAE